MKAFSRSLSFLCLPAVLSLATACQKPTEDKPADSKTAAASETKPATDPEASDSKSDAKSDDAKEEATTDPAVKEATDEATEDAAANAALGKDIPRFAAGGAWVGTFDGDDFTGEMWGVITEDGTIALRSENDTLLWGKVKLDADGPGMSADTVAYGGAYSGEKITLTGRITPEKSIRGMFKAGKDGKQTPFSLGYDASYVHPSTMKLIEGRWVHRNSTIEVTMDGGITGKTADGCTLMGKAVLIDPRFIGYELELELGDCNRNGKVKGLLGLGKEFETNDTLLWVAVGKGVGATDHLHREGTKAAARVHDVRDARGTKEPLKK